MESRGTQEENDTRKGTIYPSMRDATRSHDHDVIEFDAKGMVGLTK